MSAHASLAVVIVLILCVQYTMSSRPNAPTVVTPAGTFTGKYMTSAPRGHRYEAFLGISYAEPPIGDLRFAKPVSRTLDSEQSYDAKEYGSTCIQPLGIPEVNQYKEDEDCLYLNVFRPLATSDDAEDDTAHKVLFYIHGGGLVMGSGNIPPGDIVPKGGIIVVTFNYRLNWLGFMNGNTDALPGNQGFWDQLLALNWVKDNIRAFGGDPDDVTIAGESSGSESVTVLSASPLAKGLFTKTFAMSGSFAQNPGFPGSSESMMILAADRAGCWPGTGESTPDVVQCLKNAPVSTFKDGIDFSLLVKFLTVDGKLVPRPLPDLYSNTGYLEGLGFFSKDILGSMTSNEGLIYAFGVFADEKYKAENGYRPGLSLEYLNSPQFFNGSLGGLEGLKNILDEYEQVKDDKENRFNEDVIYDVFSDSGIMAPMFTYLEAHAFPQLPMPQDVERGRTYFLWFDPYLNYLPSTIAGAPHAIDLAYLFDLKAKDIMAEYYNMTVGEFTAEDYALKDVYIRLIANFIKHGNPGQPEPGLEWPPFALNAEYFLDFSSSCNIAQNPLKLRRNVWAKALSTPPRSDGCPGGRPPTFLLLVMFCSVFWHLRFGNE